MTESEKSKDEHPESLDVKVKDGDLVVRSKTEGVLDGLGGCVFSLGGFIPLSVGTGLFEWLLPHGVVYVLIVWFAIGGFVGGLTYYFLPRIARWFFLGRDLAVGYRKYRSFLSWSFGLAALVGGFGMVFTYAPKGWQNSNLGFTLVGIAYFGLIPILTATPALKSNNLSRLSIFHFLNAAADDKQARLWLKSGLRIVEGRVSKNGVCSLERDYLFLGCLYRLFKGTDARTDLISLSQWVVDISKTRSPSIDSLLTSAGEARTLGLSAVPTTLEKITKMPGWAISIITGATISVLLLILPYFGISSPIIEVLRQIFSH